MPNSAWPAPDREFIMRFDLPDEKRLTLEMVIPIRWGDMDAMGHVNNTLYFRYMEIVRIEWLHQVGGKPDPSGEGPVIVNAFCNFIKQLEYPGDVLAKHYVANAGRSSFDTFITLERTDAPGMIYASGGAKTVWVSFPQQKSVPLPDSVRRIVA
jgi:acyl-CoA thioester hydrolase